MVGRSTMEPRRTAVPSAVWTSICERSIATRWKPLCNPRITTARATTPAMAAMPAIDMNKSDQPEGLRPRLIGPSVRGLRLRKNVPTHRFASGATDASSSGGYAS